MKILFRYIFLQLLGLVHLNYLSFSKKGSLCFLLFFNFVLEFFIPNIILSSISANLEINMHSIIFKYFQKQLNLTKNLPSIFL